MRLYRGGGFRLLRHFQFGFGTPIQILAVILCFNMLCGIKTETVNTAVDAFLEEVDNVSLNSSIVCYKVGTT